LETFEGLQKRQKRENSKRSLYIKNKKIKNIILFSLTHSIIVLSYYV